MKFLKTFLFIVIGLSLFQCKPSPSDDHDSVSDLAFETNHGGITLPEGFQAILVSDSLGPVRHIAVKDNGDIFVALRKEKNGHGIVALRDVDGDGKADQTEYFVDNSGTGMGIHDGYLYYSSDTEVYRIQLDNEELIPSGNKETVISGFPEQKQHASKPFTFDENGHIYVTIGGPSNACQEEMRTKGSPGMNPCPQLEWHAGIWQFDANQIGQTLQTDGHKYATGLRNAMALQWSNHANSLYAVQHGRDQLSTLWPEYFNDKQNAQLPSEDFYLIKDGSNFGWPYTYFDGQRNERMEAPEYGGDGDKVAEKGRFDDPIMAFPGHWGPNGLVFYEGNQFPERYRHGAFIAFHGSWNRAPEPQAGYNVVFVPMSGELPSGEYEIFADGFAGTESFSSPSDAKGRPTGITVGPDGSLYITDSINGKIWRIVYTGEK